MGSIFIMNLSTQSSSGQKKSPGLFGVIMRGALSSLLTSKSPSGMPSKREGWIHFSITSHPPRFTALTLRLSRRCLRDCKAATPPGITKESETASPPSRPSEYWVWWFTCNSSKPKCTIFQNPETKLWQRRPFILEWILVPISQGPTHLIFFMVSNASYVCYKVMHVWSDYGAREMYQAHLP